MSRQALRGKTVTGIVKSVQRGTISGASSATIKPVNLKNSRLRYLGQTNNNDQRDDLDRVLLTFTDNTTITVSANTIGGGTVVSYEVTEYWAGVVKSIQRGTMAPGTATITAVNPAKTEVDFLGLTSTDAIPGDNSGAMLVVLTNSTTITATEGIGVTSTVGYQVVEFY